MARIASPYQSTIAQCAIWLFSTLCVAILLSPRTPLAVLPSTFFSGTLALQIELYFLTRQSRIPKYSPVHMFFSFSPPILSLLLISLLIFLVQHPAVSPYLFFFSLAALVISLCIYLLVSTVIYCQPLSALLKNEDKLDD